MQLDLFTAPEPAPPVSEGDLVAPEPELATLYALGNQVERQRRKLQPPDLYLDQYTTPEQKEIVKEMNRLSRAFHRELDRLKKHMPPERFLKCAQNYWTARYETWKRPHANR